MRIKKKNIIRKYFVIKIINKYRTDKLTFRQCESIGIDQSEKNTFVFFESLKISSIKITEDNGRKCRNVGFLRKEYLVI